LYFIAVRDAIYATLEITVFANITTQKLLKKPSQIHTDNLSPLALH